MTTRWLILSVLLALSTAAVAGPDTTPALGKPVPSLLSLPDTPLGRHFSYLREERDAMGLAEAMRARRDGRFQASEREVLGFGIGAPPVWVFLRLDNPTSLPQPRRIAIGQAWLDRIEVYLVRDGTVAASWITGDEIPGMPLLDDALGYVFDFSFPPGVTELYVRAATKDPLVLNLGLHTPQAAAVLAKTRHYGYGLLYGFLLALTGYNLMLYAGLRQKSQLLYAIYLLSFVGLNASYTGRGATWLWSDAPEVQRYVILVFMVLFTHSGLRFAEFFLDLARQAPRLRNVVRGGYWAALIGIGLLVALDMHEGAAWFAFVVITLFIFGMVGLGIIMVRKEYPAARYFLIAALSAMFGTALTDFTVLGILPFSVVSFHGMEIGVMLEATLLALALAYFVRVQVSEREQAQQLARTDPLTQMCNRRAFTELAEPLFETAGRHGRPLSVVMIDLDHFKGLNDHHGHAVGDKALVALGGLLRETARRGDTVARWGGEEFVLLLPETGLNDAAMLAERLRERITLLRLDRMPKLALSASLGVAERGEHESLEKLIADADTALYQAKSLGRNRVCLAQTASA
jgi:diguanylate cyclase (GGDEF)-like protein